MSDRIGGVIGVLAMLVIGAPRSVMAQNEKTTRTDQSCQNGNALDCFELAKLYRDGKGGLTRDGSKANEFYLKACDEGAWEACEQYGSYLLTGTDLFRRDVAVGDSLVTRACAMDTEQGKSGFLVFGSKKPRCEALVGVIKKRIGPRISDTLSAFNLMKKACKGGFKDACTLVTRWEQDPTFRKDLPPPPAPPPPPPPPSRDTTHPVAAPIEAPKPAVAEPEKPAIDAATPAIPTQRRAMIADRCGSPPTGDSTACLQAGDWFLTGIGGRRDPVVARDLFRRGCDSRNATACLRVAAMYRDGIGGARDPDRAAAAFKEACKRGERRGCDG